MIARQLVSFLDDCVCIVEYNDFVSTDGADVRL